MEEFKKMVAFFGWPISITTRRTNLLQRSITDLEKIQAKK
jgi:hypothetical protein